MNFSKKFGILALAMLMVLMMAVPAMAAEDPAKDQPKTTPAAELTPATTSGALGTDTTPAAVDTKTTPAAVDTTPAAVDTKDMKDAPDYAKVPAWAVQYMQYCFDKGYVKGDTLGNLNPNGDITRAEAVQTLYSMAGQPTNGAVKVTFTDITGKWYEKSASWAGSVGVYGSEENAVYDGDHKLTRAEMADLFYGYAKAQNKTTVEGGMAMKEAPDYDQVPAGSLEAMTFCYYADIMKGDTEGNLTPNATATRAQFCRMLQSLDEYMTKAETTTGGGVTTPTGGAVK